MICNECGGNYREKRDLIEVIDPYVGQISIQGVPFYICDTCENILYTEEIVHAIDHKRNNLIHEILHQFPIGDFINASGTASILGISRQALHKNRRIRHGFIYQISFSGCIVYLKQSVLQFKRTGDGRFPLYLQEYHPSIQYLEDTVPIKLGSPYIRSTSSKSLRSSFQTSDTHLFEEDIYVN